MASDPTREAAYALLTAVVERRRTLEDALNALPVMDARDRSAGHRLAAAVLRRSGTLDAVLEPWMRKAPPEPVRQVLRIGAAGLLLLEMPPHAAVATAVALARTVGLTPFTSLVNAVLRRVAAGGPRVLETLDSPRLDTPAWLWASWGADARAIAEAHQHEAPLDFTLGAGFAMPKGVMPEGTTPQGAKPEGTMPEGVTPEGTMPDGAMPDGAMPDGAMPDGAMPDGTMPEGTMPTGAMPEGATPTGAMPKGAMRLPTGAVRYPAGTHVADVPGFAEGRLWVQDAAAAVPAVLLAPRPGERIADLGASPGGKTAQLLTAGARVTAVERDPVRLARLADNLRRWGLTAELVQADALTWTPEEPFDAVLLDAPCSATGTIRRHPDVPHLKRPRDIKLLSEAQDRLLAAAARLLRPGGRLIYAVCSLQPEEGAARLAATGLRVEPFRPEELPGLPEAITPEGWLRTHPGMWREWGGMDGFFAGRLVRG